MQGRVMAENCLVTMETENHQILLSSSWRLWKASGSLVLAIGSRGRTASDRSRTVSPREAVREKGRCWPSLTTDLGFNTENDAHSYWRGKATLASLLKPRHMQRCQAPVLQLKHKISHHEYPCTSADPLHCPLVCGFNVLIYK